MLGPAAKYLINGRMKKYGGRSLGWELCSFEHGQLKALPPALEWLKSAIVKGPTLAECQFPGGLQDCRRSCERLCTPSANGKCQTYLWNEMLVCLSHSGGKPGSTVITIDKLLSRTQWPDMSAKGWLQYCQRYLHECATFLMPILHGVIWRKH